MLNRFILLVLFLNFLSSLSASPDCGSIYIDSIAIKKNFNYTIYLRIMIHDGFDYKKELKYVSKNIKASITIDTCSCRAYFYCDSLVTIYSKLFKPNQIQIKYCKDCFSAAINFISPTPIDKITKIQISFSASGHGTSTYAVRCNDFLFGNWQYWEDEFRFKSHNAIAVQLNKLYADGVDDISLYKRAITKHVKDSVFASISDTIKIIRN